MIVELVCVGTELLLGNIVNTNAAYLAEMCARLGLSMYYQSVVGDNEERMTQVIAQAVDRSDVVILCGGLGPTQDDLTKEVTAKVMGMKLVEDEHTRNCIQEYMNNLFVGRPDAKITDNNWKQALVPEGALILDNANGTAPGLIIEENGKIVILLPGPPNELKPMFENQVYPYLREKQPEVILSRMIKICGIGESAVEDKIQDMIDAQNNPTIATYAKTGEVHLRVTARAESEAEAKKMIKPVVRELKVRFGKNIYTTDEHKTLEECVIDLLKDQELELTTVESCTGGALAARLVNVPGASDVLKQGLVTYSNKSKRKFTLVKKSTLKDEGAVSHKTAKEMAKGAVENTGCDVSVSVTGLAGPNGGTKEKPVGLVYIGCCYKGKTTVREFHFNGNRSKVREQAVVQGLVLLRDCILENYVNE
ncbi:MAG: competence/damage-inducible protein A [Oliverpabstia sp.]|nr:competence/damage-inducible protein A [Lachnospiraceae bacterium]MDY5026285.1 competence/damage-inducible protein A [Oliverpabstia sp.]